MSDIENLEYMEYLKEHDHDLYLDHGNYHEELIKSVHCYKPTCRKNNGANEKTDILNILYHLNKRTPFGQKMIQSLEQKFNIIFNKAIEKPGPDRKSHYDFIVIDDKGKKYQVEHKGSKKFKQIKPNSKPWENSVQFANIKCNDYTIAPVYARLWYDEYIKSGDLSNQYNMKTAIPTFDEWYKKDCCTYGEPKTPFGVALNKIAKRSKGVFSDLKGAINKKLLTKIKDNQLLKEEAMEVSIRIGKEYMADKDLWLQITGDLNGDLNKVNFKWYGPIKLCDKYKMKESFTSDVIFNFECNDTSYFNFECKLRWGNRIGISGLRVGLY